VTTQVLDLPIAKREARTTTPAAPRAMTGDVVRCLLPLIAAAIALLVHKGVTSHQTSLPTRIYPKLLIDALILWTAVLLASALLPAVRRWAVPRGPLFAVAILLICGWDLITLKWALLPLPYFPGPDMVFQSLADDRARLLDCAIHSLELLFAGYAVGAILGVISGVAIGWSSGVRYWGMPVLKIIGPIPATAFIPLVLMLLPTAFTSGMTLIALAVWFPVTMLAASGIANVRKSFLDVARTLGAGRAYLIFRVAIPAAMPSIFVGLFMGLGSSFLTLIVAETVGVKSGLGWYIGWAKTWADYAKVYAALIIMAVFFSAIMTLLFKIRDRVLVYQKGTIQW
jgi:NitT/TauT family transport system permease protein